MSSRLDLIKDWVPLMKRAHFRANEMPEVVGASGRSLRRVFKREFGKPLQKVLNESRGAEAKEMLLAGNDEKTICEILGFKSAAHFSDWFKGRHGACPRDFVLQSRDAGNGSGKRPNPDVGALGPSLAGREAQVFGHEAKV